MSVHKWRDGISPHARLPYRDWFRANKPSGFNGYVVEDLDLVLRVYGNRYGSDSNGKFMLIELKYGNSYAGKAQIKTFGLIHRLLRKADPHKKRYIGLFCVQYNNEDWDKADFRVNKKSVSNYDFINRFLEFDLGFIESLPENM